MAVSLSVKCPAAHGWHDVWPVMSWYWPGTQSLHVALVDTTI
jgi:hypothetical protein